MPPPRVTTCTGRGHSVAAQLVILVMVVSMINWVSQFRNVKQLRVWLQQETMEAAVMTTRVVRRANHWHFLQSDQQYQHIRLVCWYLTALSEQTGYIMPQEYEIYSVGLGDKTVTQ